MMPTGRRKEFCSGVASVRGTLVVVPIRMHDDEVGIDEALVRRLLDSQFPEFGGQRLRIVEPWGTDNAIWRLGDDLVIRMPRIHWATQQVDREARWLPRLAPHLTVTVPDPIAVGRPADDYPYRWAIHRWLPGEPAHPDRIHDPQTFAVDLARTVIALRALPTDGAPPARNRARPIQDYDGSTRRAIHAARDLIDDTAALRIWDEALEAPPHVGRPVWVHGDLEGNCLLTDGRLTGLVDWGSACAGDPAVDVQVVWSPLFSEDARARFLDLVSADDATIARNRGAAVNQACAALPYYLHTYPLIVDRSRHKLRALGIGVRDTQVPPTR
jgi:aminoglycoside phosphotransferase (APT) family kinase protein